VNSTHITNRQIQNYSCEINNNCTSTVNVDASTRKQKVQQRHTGYNYRPTLFHF